MNKKIGVVGGMGPMASQLFYKMVTEMTEAEKDQDHLNMVILSDSSMLDRTKAILSGDEEEVRRKLREDLQILARCGCEAACITCNTAHYFADQVEGEVDIPIIHMIKETAGKIAKENPGGKIAILATDGTIRTGLYQKRLEEAGVQPYIPAAETQKQVMYQIYDRIKKGLDWDAASWDTIEDEVRRAGCSRAIMACTELSVIKADNGLSDFYVDPMEVLAERAIEFAGKTVKKNRKQE